MRRVQNALSPKAIDRRYFYFSVRKVKRIFAVEWDVFLPFALAIRQSGRIGLFQNASVFFQQMAQLFAFLF